ncbi:MAG: cation:proton antiporter [Luteolibacter sp.]
MRKTTLFYLVTLLVVGFGILAILHFGKDLPSPGGVPQHSATAFSDSLMESVAKDLKHHVNQPLSHLFVQLLVIIGAARLLGGLFTKLGQPSVIGEMTAGILLGPSLFGLLAPDAFHFVFPTESLGTLKLLSQLGVCLFMFTVGMELNMQHVRHKAHVAVVVSHASIVAPYFLGVALAYFLFSRLAQPGTSFTAFALFMGISMSITAFPVLARILGERKLTKTFLGSTAITCAAVDDVTAWSALAFVVAIAKATSIGASALNLSLVVLFIAVMLYGVRLLLPRVIGAQEFAQPDPSRRTLALVVCVVIGAAFCTEVIGIHALFGAFLAGAIMPDINNFRHKLSVRVENFSTVLLLPLFFAYTGLRTQIGLVNDLNGWLLCGLIISVATLGKLGGTAITARFTGIGWRDSLRLGALMNTRGLMELIALNIGYDLGILSPRIFTMFVIMALVTTCMTGPLLTLFGRLREEENSEVLAAEKV